MPVLVIMGDENRIVPPADSFRLAGKLLNAELVVVEYCGHLPHEEPPQIFMQAVTQFCEAKLRP